MGGVVKKSKEELIQKVCSFPFPPDKGGNSKGGLLGIYVASGATPETNKQKE
jgi:hypothetical protein